MSCSLSVNLNAVAMLRNRRDLPWPSVAGIGALALDAGAAGLTVHPRPDQRHIRFSDLPLLQDLLARYPGKEFNIEGYPSADFMDLVEAHKPDQVTLVPDAPEQATSDHGWDFVADRALLAPLVARLKAGGMRVSAFCEPNAKIEQIETAAELGVDRVELYTGPYGACYDDPALQDERREQLCRTAALAAQHGLGVNAGHDLTLDNLGYLLELCPQIAEVSIGHGLTAAALEMGMPEAVRRFVAICQEKTG